MVSKKSLKINAILNTVKTILGIVFPLITFPYVSRILSVGSLGAYNFSASIISYCLLVAGLGISTYAIREGTQYRDDPEKIRKFVSDVFSINVWAMIFSYLLLAGLIVFVPPIGKYSLMLWILSAQIAFTTIGANWLCNIYEDFLYITIRTLLFQILSLIAMFVFVKSESDIYVYIVIVTFANSASYLLNFFYLRKKYVKFSFTLACNWKQHIKPILIIFSTTITITLYVNSDITILGLTTSDYQVGLYSAAVKIYTIVKNVLISIVVVLIPRFSILLKDSDTKKAEELFSNVFNTITLLVIPAVVGLIMLCQDIMQLVAGENYIDSGAPLGILSLATVFSLYAYMYTNCVFIPKKKESIVFTASLMSAMVNIALNLLFIPKWGIVAAAITTVIAEMIICVISVYIGNKYIRLLGVWRPTVSVIMGCASIVCVCLVCMMFITKLFLKIAVSIIGSVLAYGVMLIIFGHPIIMNYISKITKKRGLNS